MQRVVGVIEGRWVNCDDDKQGKYYCDVAVEVGKSGRWKWEMLQAVGRSEMLKCCRKCEEVKDVVDAKAMDGDSDACRGNCSGGSVAV